LSKRVDSRISAHAKLSRRISEGLAVSNAVGMIVLVIFVSTLVCSNAVPAQAQSGRSLDLYGGAVNGNMSGLIFTYNSTVYGPNYQFPSPLGGQGPNVTMDTVENQSLVYLWANLTYNSGFVGNKNVAFEIDEPNGSLYTDLVAFSDINGVAGVNITMPWVIESKSLFGVWTVTATVEIADQVVNDTVQFQYSHVPFHEVIVVSVTAPTWMYQDLPVIPHECANITVTVENVGDFPENVTVSLYYNITADLIIGSFQVQLDVGQSFTHVFVWVTVGVPPGTYTLTAVATIPTGSFIYTDGDITVRLYADVNGDGKVDLRDLALVARAFGSTPSSPNWNPFADINCDGRVDMKDIALVVRNFGRHYP
jgi:hypothetical protein